MLWTCSLGLGISYFYMVASEYALLLVQLNGISMWMSTTCCHQILFMSPALPTCQPTAISSASCLWHCKDITCCCKQRHRSCTWGHSSSTTFPFLYFASVILNSVSSACSDVYKTLVSHTHAHKNVGHFSSIAFWVIILQVFFSFFILKMLLLSHSYLS